MSAILLRRRPFGQRTLIIGTTPLARRLVAEIAARCKGSSVLAGVVAEADGPVHPPFNELLVGPLAGLGAIVQAVRPDRIVLALADRRGRLPMRELLEAR